MASLCPVFQEPQFTDNGEFLVGGLVWFYEAGSSTLAIAYTDNTGSVAWPNPIVLDSRGECSGTIWLDESTAYRITLESKPAYGQTHGVVITEHDNITGIASAQTPQDWVTFTGSPTYVSTTSFTVLGDYRDIFVANRKLRITDSGGVSVHSIISSSFGTSTTTVNVTGLIDSGISLVEYAFVTPDASPDRFEDLIVNDDITVSGDAVLDGNLNGVAIANYWNNNNSPSVFAANGYQKLNSGLIIQWGVVTTSATGGGVTVTFPTAFTTTNYSVTVTTNTGSFASFCSAVSKTSTTFAALSFLHDGTQNSVGANWIAMGY